MKKTITAIALLVGVLGVKAQEVSVEKNMFGFQLGLLSASVQYETKLDREIALHFEGGIMNLGGTVESKSPDQPDKSLFSMVPFLSVEPRWYYGLDRRTRLKRRTANNSSNFISLYTAYTFGDLAFAQNYKQYEVPSMVIVAPTFGIRRSFAKNFNYEFSGGVGYQYNLYTESKYNKSQFAVPLQVKIGYNF